MRAFWVTASLLLLPLAPLEASAQISEQRLADYRLTAERGAAAFNEGDLTTARALFERAASILPNPRVYRLLGRVALAQQSYVEAMELFQRALTIDDAGLPLSEELRRQVETELLPQARAQVAEYRLDLSPPDALVTVDGRSATIVAGSLVLAPGAHAIAVAAPGHQRFEQQIDAPRGVREVLRVHLARDGETSEGSSSGVVHVPTGPDEGMLGGGIAALALGVLGLGAFATVGAIAVSDREELAGSCGVTMSCPHDALADVERLNIAADISLAVGATAAVIGAVLVGLAFAGSGEEGSVSAWVDTDGAGLIWSRRW